MQKQPTQASDLIILVVDDDTVVRDLVKRLLLRFAVGTVFTAGSAREALIILGKRPVHGIVCDIEMEGLTGLDLLQQIRRGDVPKEPGALHTTPTFLPVIMLTGHATEDLVEKAARFGADAYITKPVKPPVLQKAMDRMIQRWQHNLGLGLRFTKVRRPEYTRFELIGQLIPRNQAVVRDLVRELDEDTNGNVVLDLSGLGFVEEFGFGTLLTLNGIALAKGKRLALISDSTAVSRDLAAVPIKDVIPLYPSQVDYARAVMGAGEPKPAPTPAGDA